MKYNINLVQKRSSNTFERVVYFFSNYLRYILVITQLVVIGVLFFRFRIDQNIADLKESIKSKKAIIEADVVKDTVKNALTVQKQSQELLTIIKDQQTVTEILNYLLATFPRDIVLTTMNIEASEVKMDGETGDALLIKRYFNKLKKDKKFSSVELSDIKRTESGFTFSLILSKFKSTAL